MLPHVLCLIKVVLCKRQHAAGEYRVTFCVTEVAALTGSAAEAHICANALFVPKASLAPIAALGAQSSTASQSAQCTIHRNSNQQPYFVHAMCSA